VINMRQRHGRFISTPLLVAMLAGGSVLNTAAAQPDADLQSLVDGADQRARAAGNLLQGMSGPALDGAMPDSNTSITDLRSMVDSADRQSRRSGSDLLEGMDLSAPQLPQGTPERAELEGVVEQFRQRSMATMQQAQDDAGVPAAIEGKYAGVEYFYFISLSMGEAEIREVYQEAARNEGNSIVVIQGIPEGTKLPAGLMPFYDIGKDMSPPPRLVLDPSLFKTLSVDTVPVVVRRAPDAVGEVDQGSIIASVDGLRSRDYLDRQVEDGKTGDLGIQGQPLAIAEPNLIDVMKERVAKVDWETKAHKAVDTFWDKQEYLGLVPGTEAKVRTVDPTIQVTRDLTAPNGEVIVAAGTVINPLDQMPFNRRLYVFDATRPQEVAFVKEQLEGLTVTDPIPVVIASKFPNTKGWDGYKALTDTLNHHVYKLTPDIKSRWQLSVTPSVIEADDRVFKVTEYALTPELNHDAS